MNGAPAVRPLSSWRRIAWIGSLFIGLVTALAAWDIVGDYRRTVDATARELRSQALVVTEQTARSLQTVDLVLRHIEDEFRSGALERMDGERLHAYLADQAVGLMQIEALVLRDTSGKLRATSSTEEAAKMPMGPTGAALDALRNDPGIGPVVGGVEPAGASGAQRVFPVVRALETAAGDFAGVAAAEVRVEYFRKFYHDVRFVDGTKINLIHRDGTLLARYPAVDSALGGRFPLFDTVLARHATDPGDPLRITSPLDGVERLGALAPVAGYPLAVVVARDVGLALAPWRARAVGTAARTLALDLLAAMLMLLLRRKLAHLNDARESLETSRERFALAAVGSDVGIWDWDIARGRVFASPRVLQIYGLDPDPEACSRGEWFGALSGPQPSGGEASLLAGSRDEWFAAIRIHPDDVARRNRDIRAHLAGETPAYFGEYRVHRGDGAYRWVRVRGVCVRDAGGQPLRMAGSVADIDSQKRAEDALRLSEERFALAVAGSDDGVWDFDYARDEAFASRRARQIMGLPLEPEVQRPLREWVAALPMHPDDAKAQHEAVLAHLAGRTPAFAGEWRFRRPGGGWRWARVRGVCVHDAQGLPLRMAGSVADIDARKRAEEALRQSEERFALAVAGSNDGILDWDILADSMYVSDRARAIAGVPSDAMIRSRGDAAALLMARLHPDDARRLSDKLRGLADDRYPAHDGEYRVRHADGEYRWIRFRGMTVQDAAGRPIRWAGSVSDIDAAKKIEEALRRSEERYELAVAGSNEGLWDWDLPGDRLFLSPRAQELLWLEPAEPQQSRRYWIDHTHYHADDVPMVRAAISAHLRGATQHFMVEYRLRHHSGEWHWYRQRGIAVRDAQGRPARMAGSMEDITDRKHAEEQRERLELQLRQAQKLEAIGTLAGGIAHDFNNILAAILGYGEMAQKDAPEGSALRRHIDSAISAGMRAKSLVERILAFSRSGVGERVAIHVESAIAEALDGVAASLPPGVRLERRLAAADAAVLGDPTQMHQVVMNLCANAVQAMRSRGELTVTLDRIELAMPNCATCRLPRGNYVRLEVSDTGAGIAPDVLERIFDPFFTTKEIGVGTGLGLSLVHGIVADLGGGIDVQSHVGAGSTFTVFLPRHDGVAAPALAGEAAAPGGRGETILLVDDEEPLVRLGEEMIAGLGYEPVGFTSSGSALAAFGADPGRFDAVLSDEAMPGMTGSELAQKIRRIRPDIPIVLMSGYVTPALAASARDTGVVDVLSKPLASRDISRSLASALRRRADAAITTETARTDQDIGA